jgi:16S rRNA (uracil1498-N3)-methyltransferase
MFFTMDHNIFYVNSDFFHANEAVIQGPELRHVRNALRKKRGERITLTDGKGYRYTAEIHEVRQSKMVVKILKKEQQQRRHSVEVSLGFVPVKGSRNDMVVEKGTELGVARFIIFRSAYAVLPNVGQNKLERFRKIAQSAMVQSKQYYLPEITYTRDFDEMLKMCKEYDQILVADPKGKFGIPAGARRILFVIGPEGGLSEPEIDSLVKMGAILTGLGPTRLRSETAAIVGVSKILTAYGEI